MRIGNQLWPVRFANLTHFAPVNSDGRIYDRLSLCCMTKAPKTATSLLPRDVGALWGRRQADELSRNLEQRINALLPPEYQDRYEDVSPQSMGTAPLLYDRERGKLPGTRSGRVIATWRWPAGRRIAGHCWRQLPPGTLSPTPRNTRPSSLELSAAFAL